MKLTAKVLFPILAVSLSQIARAVSIDTFQSGNWSDPASWNGGAFPDTYAGDSATINLGHVIDFDNVGGGNGPLSTPLSPLGGTGGLAVIAGSTILIDGGTLTQSALPIEIRIGEGSGGAGNGTLTIQNGGTFNSGAARGVGVGTSLNATLGSGIVNVIDGSFIMGAGAGVGGLGVGLDGSTGVINVGDNAGGAGTAILDLATSSIGMGIGYNFATATGGIGSVIVSADGKIKQGTAGIVVGQSGGTGSLTILSGGQLTSTGGGITVGDNAGFVDPMTMLFVHTTKGALIVSGGTITSSGEIRINGVGLTGPGYGFDMSGAASVSTTGDFNVGSGGSTIGTARQSGGVLSGNNFYVGRGAGTGTYSLTSGTATFTNEIRVGRDGGSNGTLNITGASVVGASALSQGTVDGEGGNRAIRAGSGGGTGAINISGGGSLNTTNEWFALGDGDGSAGTTTVDGTGSTLSSHGLIVGWNGLSTGTLSISNNAVVTNTVHEVSIGRDNGGANSPTGVINISSGGVLNAGRDLRIGHNAAGTVNINGGTLNAQGGWAIIGDGGTANGTVNLASGTMNNSEWLIVGNNSGAQGLLNVNGGTLNANAGGDNGRLIVGRSGTAVLNQTAGAIHVGNWLGIAIDPGSNGTYNMAGGTLDTTSSVDIANNNSTGTMNITGGAGTTVNIGNELNVGRGNAGSNGTFTMAAGSAANVTVNGELNIGRNNATGAVNVAGGVLRVNGWSTLGRDSNSGSGTLNVSNGGVFTHAQHNGGDFLIGWTNGSTGAVNVTNGGTVNYSWWTRVGVDPGSTGSILVDNGSTFHQTGGRTYIGEKATGSLTITRNSHYTVDNSVSDGDVFKVGGGDGVADAGHGTLTIDATSTLSVWDRVSIGDGVNAGVPATGTVNVTGGSITAFTNGGGDFFRVGTRGGTGTVNITAGGTVNTNAGWFTLGENDGSVGQATFSGTGTTLNAHGIIVGWNGSGNGTLTIQNNAVVNNTGAGHELSIARDNANTQGTVNITSGGTLNAGRAFRIGANGIGTVNINAGTFIGTAGDWSYIGDGSSSHGAVNMTNGTFTDNDSLMIANNNGAHGTFTQDGTSTTLITNEITVGRAGGIGAVTINGGSFRVNNTAYFGRDGGSNGTFSMSGASSSFVGGASVRFGESGTSVATITGGAGSSGGETIVGNNPGGSGIFNLSGAGTTWASGGEFQVGNNGGIGVANISGGTLNLLGYLALGRNTDQNGRLNGGNGTLVLSGTGVLHKVNNNGSFDVGSWNGGNNNTTNTSGTLTQTGGSVVIDGNSSVYVGRDRGVVGNWTITGGTVAATAGEFRIHRDGGAANDAMSVGGNGAFSLVAANASYVGGGSGSGSGTLSITNPNATFTFNDEFWVGNGLGSGVMNMTTGTITANSWFDIGRDGGTGVVNLSNGTINNTGREFIVADGQNGGVGGIGTLTQTGGAIVKTNGDVIVAKNGGSLGIWNMTAGSLTQTGSNLNVGQGGNGTFTISGTGVITANINTLNVAPNGGTTGVMTVGGTGVSSVTASDHIEIGQGGGANGTLNISDPNATISTPNRIMVGDGGSHGEVHQSAGTVSQGGQWFSIAGGGGSSALYDISGGHLISAGGFEVGSDGTGTLTVSGTGLVTANGMQAGVRSPSVGVINVSGNGSIANTGELVLGGGQGTSTGTLNQAGASTVTANGFYVGARNGASTGTATIIGGTFTNNGGTEIGGSNAGATGSLSVSGSAVYSHPQHGNDMQIGYNGGNGTVNVSSGGTLLTNWWVNIGRGGGSVGAVNVDGAGSTFTVGDGFLNVGEDGTGTLNVTGGGKVWVKNVGGFDFSIARNGGSTGTLAVSSGGKVQATYISAGGGTAQLNLNGGILIADASEGNFLRNFNPANSNILAGGVTFDSNNFNITASNQMAGVGGLTKISNGTLTLTAQNLYAGVTNLNGGSVNVGTAENAGTSGPLGNQAANAVNTIFFGGGTLQYSGANQNDYSGRFSTGVNQAYRVDTNSQNVTWATSLVSSGGSLTKFGNGKLTLPVANTYTAGTVIHGGTVNIISNAALGGPAGGVMIDNNAILQAAGPVTSNRTFTLGAGGGTIDTNGQTVTIGTGTITGTALTEADTAGGGVLNINSGTNATGLAALTTTGGVTNLSTALGTGTSTITANATLNIYASQTLASLNIADGVEVTFGDGSPFAPEPPKPSAPFGGGGAGLVPEPGSLGLLLVGALGFIARRRRSR